MDLPGDMQRGTSNTTLVLRALPVFGALAGILFCGVAQAGQATSCNTQVGACTVTEDDEGAVSFACTCADGTENEGDLTGLSIYSACVEALTVCGEAEGDEALESEEPVGDEGGESEPSDFDIPADGIESHELPDTVAENGCSMAPGQGGHRWLAALAVFGLFGVARRRR